MTLKIGALIKLGLFFPVVCFTHVFYQTLAEQLYRVYWLMVGWLICWLLDWFINWMVDNLLIAWLVGWLVSWLVG